MPHRNIFILGNHNEELKMFGICPKGMNKTMTKRERRARAWRRIRMQWKSGYRWPSG